MGILNGCLLISSQTILLIVCVYTCSIISFRFDLISNCLPFYVPSISQRVMFSTSPVNVQAVKVLSMRPNNLKGKGFHTQSVPLDNNKRKKKEKPPEIFASRSISDRMYIHLLSLPPVFQICTYFVSKEIEASAYRTTGNGYRYAFLFG